MYLVAGRKIVFCEILNCSVVHVCVCGCKFLKVTLTCKTVLLSFMQLMDYSHLSSCTSIYNVQCTCTHIPETLGSLVQTIPEGNFPVCANEQLSYTCKSSFGTLLWQQGDSFHQFSSTHSQVNDSETVGQFLVELTETNGTFLISTATCFMTNSSHESIRLECFDGATLLGEDVNVAGMSNNSSMCANC